MRGNGRSAGLAVIVVAMAGIAWFGLELVQPILGFADTDSPEVSLRFLRAYPTVYAWAGTVLLVAAVAMTVAALAVSEVLVVEGGALAVRTTTALGTFAAVFLLAHGVTRLSVGPLLYIDSLDRGWGQTAYLVIQLAGIHGAAQAAIVSLCLWGIGVALLCWRTRALPRWLCALAVIPGFRLLGVLGPLGVAEALPDGLWLVFMLAIPGTMVWFLVLGLALMRRRSRPVIAGGLLA